MKKILTTGALVAFSLFANHAFAASACEMKAEEKKLAGAAKTSFMKKCDKDSAGSSAHMACEKSAVDKKLAGAAKTSHIKKCEADMAAPKKP